MKLKQAICILVFCALILALAAPVGALIKLENTVSDTYGASKVVLVGKVAALLAETRVVDVTVDETLKGKSPGERIRIQVVAPAEILKEIAPGQPLVFFLGETEGGGVAVVHVADTWLLANGVPNSNLQVWRVVKMHETMRQAFPGRTAALVRLLADLRAGKNTILNKWDRKPFAGGVRKRAALKVQKPTWILAADVNGDKKPDLLVGSAAGTRLFLAAADGYTDVTETWGAWGTAGGYHACGDVDGDGKVDLLLDGTLWLNQGGKFVAATARLETSAKGRPLGAALADVSGDQKPDALLLTAHGELRIYENPGSADKPWPLRETKMLWNDTEAAEKACAAFGDWGDNGKLCVMVVSKSSIVRYALDAGGGPPADLVRLTGVDIRKNAKYRNGLNNVLAAALHMSESPRPDLFAVCDTGALLLVNRGFGAFLLDDNAGGPLTPGAKDPPPLALSPSTPWTAADLHGHGVDDLLVLGEDGTLYELDNGAAAPGR